MSEARAHLNITSTVHDGELVGVIAAAEAAIAQRVGPLEPTTVTARLSGNTALVLPVHPAISLTSISDAAGTAQTVGQFALDGANGVLSYAAAGTRFSSAFYTVTYQAGRPAGALPADLLFAVKELVRHLWDSQRGPTRRPGMPSSDGAANSMAGAGYLLPFRVQELLTPHLQFGIG